MARNRMIKPEFFTSKNLCACSIESNHLFAALWCFGDDSGSIDYSERLIMGEIYRNRPQIKWKKVKNWIEELRNAGVIIYCEYRLSPYLVVTHWDEHQIIDHPSQRRYLEESIAYEARLLFQKVSGSGETTVYNAEKTLSVSTLKEKVEREIEIRKRKRNRILVSENPPTVEEVKQYCISRSNNVDAQRFVDHYTTRGWTYGKQNVPMVDWRAAVRTWEQSGYSDNKENKPTTPSYHQRLQ